MRRTVLTIGLGLVAIVGAVFIVSMLNDPTPAIAQTPLPVQGRDTDNNLYRVVKVDSQGRLVVVSSSSTLSCVNPTPCLVIGATANGSIIDASANPLIVGIASSGGRARTWFSPDAVLDANNGQNSASVVPSLFNGTTYDRWRSAAGSSDNVTGFGSTRGNNILLNQNANYDREYVCDKQQAFNLAAATDVVVVPAAASKTTKICHLDFSVDTGQTATIQQGTGSTCGTSTAALTGGYALASTFAMDYSNKASLRNTTTNVDTCLHFSSAVTGGGVAIYAQF